MEWFVFNICMHFIRENVDVVSFYKKKRTLVSKSKFVVDILFFPTDLYALLLNFLKINWNKFNFKRILLGNPG